MEVHRTLGHGFLEVVYKDAIDWELRQSDIIYEREKEFTINYKEVTLPHRFYADFFIHDKIILEVKAAEGGIADLQIAQTLNYLKASNCKIGLLINFGRGKLEYRRPIF